MKKYLSIVTATAVLGLLAACASDNGAAEPENTTATSAPMTQSEASQPEGVTEADM